MEQRAVMQAFYSRANDRSNTDLILIKERVRKEDNTETTNIRLINNFKRTFYTTRPHHRETHKLKKEYETLENLDEHVCTQAEMPSKIAKALNVHTGYPNLRDLKASPYLYGADVSTTSLIRAQYKTRYPGYEPKATVATLDLETNVLSKRKEIIYGTVTYKDKVVLVTTRAFMQGIDKPEEKLQALFIQYLSKYKKERDITLHVRVVENDLGVVRILFKSLHRLMPDFVSIWNMRFDIGKIMDCLKYYKVDPRDIFSDPMVPPHLRSFNWHEDNPIKTTATGKKTSKDITELWHVVDAPASFYIIDSMCLFRRLRVRERARHSYALDAILGEMLNLSKLKFAVADDYTGIEWHKFMQRHHKLEYGIYNIFDGIALELLDEKTNDIALAVLPGADTTDLKNYASGPKMLANTLDGYLKERGKIICTTSADMTEEFDHLIIDTRGWIDKCSTRYY